VDNKKIDKRNQKVTCHRCMQEFYMDMDAHYSGKTKHKKDALSTMCPLCCAWVSVIANDLQ